MKPEAVITFIILFSQTSHGWYIDGEEGEIARRALLLDIDSFDTSNRLVARATTDCIGLGYATTPSGYQAYSMRWTVPHQGKFQCPACFNWVYGGPAATKYFQCMTCGLRFEKLPGQAQAWVVDAAGRPWPTANRLPDYTPTSHERRGY